MFLLFLFLGGSFSVQAATGLPFTDGFESGNFSAWDGGRTNNFTVSSSDAHTGLYAARGISVLGSTTDYYQDAYFGDHPTVRGTPATGGLYVRFTHKFESGFDFGNSDRYNKILLINFEDENDRRREQVILYVGVTYSNGSRRGEYLIENIHWNADGSFGSGQVFLQNIGAPTAFRSSAWDMIKIHIVPNNVGQSDGRIRVWINGEMKLEHVDISIRQTQYNPNLVIIGSYTSDAGLQGTRWWDDVTISETDPANGAAGKIPSSPNFRGVQP